MNGKYACLFQSRFIHRFVMEHQGNYAINVKYTGGPLLLRLWKNNRVSRKSCKRRSGEYQNKPCYLENGVVREPCKRRTAWSFKLGLEIFYSDTKNRTVFDNWILPLHNLYQFQSCAIITHFFQSRYLLRKLLTYNFAYLKNTLFGFSTLDLLKQFKCIKLKNYFNL